MEIQGSDSDDWNRKPRSKTEELLVDVNAETVSVKLDSDACRVRGSTWLVTLPGELEKQFNSEVAGEMNSSVDLCLQLLSSVEGSEELRKDEAAASGRMCESLHE